CRSQWRLHDEEDEEDQGRRGPGQGHGGWQSRSCVLAREQGAGADGREEVSGQGGGAGGLCRVPPGARRQQRGPPGWRRGVSPDARVAVPQVRTSGLWPLLGGAARPGPLRHSPLGPALPGTQLAHVERLVLCLRRRGGDCQAPSARADGGDDPQARRPGLPGQRFGGSGDRGGGAGGGGQPLPSPAGPWGWAPAACRRAGPQQPGQHVLLQRRHTEPGSDSASGDGAERHVGRSAPHRAAPLT
ncbi:unnamed protein product, partial [Lampetra planeri]